MVVPDTRPNHCDYSSPEPFLVAGALMAAAPPEIFDPFPMDVHSTKLEAQVAAELRRRGIKKAIVLTSNFHARRARHVFHQQGGHETVYLLPLLPNRTSSPMIGDAAVKARKCFYWKPGSP